jgi:selenocysteine-specific elongation factor
VHVIATAGHVDHGKSTLVRALTGTDPDRLEEERRRGLTIELGYAWTELEGAGEVAFVDVPGHERFIATMLAGVGPVPAALLVVAADDPWMPQAAEHLAALDALGVRHGVVAVSRCDLADPAEMVARARAELAATTLREAPVVPVSATTGAGVAELREHLAATVAALPPADPDAPVRLWVDRRFTVKGAGTVVTGTLPSGTVRVGDSLTTGESSLRVRGVQSLGRPVPAASGVARVALNLTADGRDVVGRGSVLVAPGRWQATTSVDVVARPAGPAGPVPPERPLLHIGATSVAAHCRPLGEGLVRLRLDRPLPLHVGDRALLRDPGSRHLWGVSVLDPAPPPLRRRGAAPRRAAELAVARPGLAADEVDRRGLVAVDLLVRIGVRVEPEALEGAGVVLADGWLMSRARAESAARQLTTLVAEHERRSPLSAGLALPVLAERLGLPSVELVRAVVSPPLRVEAGQVTARSGPALPEGLRRTVEVVLADLAETPFTAPTADRLAEIGLDNKGAAAAAKAGLLLRPAPGIVLPPGADALAAERLAELPQPFTTSEARAHLGTSRRVALPLLDHLDRRGLTRRHPDDRREVIGR